MTTVEREASEVVRDTWRASFVYMTRLHGCGVQRRIRPSPTPIERQLADLQYTPLRVWGLLWGICTNEPHPAQTLFRPNSATSLEHYENPDPPVRAHNPEVGGSNPSPATKMKRPESRGLRALSFIPATPVLWGRSVEIVVQKVPRAGRHGGQCHTLVGELVNRHWLGEFVRR